MEKKQQNTGGDEPAHQLGSGQVGFCECVCVCVCVCVWRGLLAPWFVVRSRVYKRAGLGSFSVFLPY